MSDCGLYNDENGYLCRKLIITCNLFKNCDQIWFCLIYSLISLFSVFSIITIANSFVERGGSGGASYCSSSYKILRSVYTLSGVSNAVSPSKELIMEPITSRALTKYIKQECFVGVQYQSVIKLCPPFARYIGSKIFLEMPVPTTSLSSYFIGCHLRIYLFNTNYLESGQDQWIPKALFSYFSKKMFAVGTHWKRLFLIWMTALPLAD